MEAAYRKEADCMIVPMPREVDHHVAGNMSREIDLLAESWHDSPLVEVARARGLEGLLVERHARGMGG